MKSNPHCILVRSYENIKEILADDQNSIQIKVTLSHGLTSLTNVFVMEFAKSAIKEGHFKPGPDFVIL